MSHISASTNWQFLTATLNFFDNFGAIYIPSDHTILLSNHFINFFKITPAASYTPNEIKRFFSSDTFNLLFKNEQKAIKQISFSYGNKKYHFTRECQKVTASFGTYITYRLQFLNTSSVNRKLSSDKFLQLVVNNIPEAIFWKDRHSIYQGCNQKFADIAGVATPNDIIGKTDYELPWSKKESDFFVKMDQDVMSKGKGIYNIIESQLLEDNTTVWINKNKMPLKDERGNVIGVLGTFEDVTTRVEHEELLQKNLKLIKKQKIELEKYINSNVELERFAFVASHDMKTPLRTIISFSQLLKRSLKGRIHHHEIEYLDFIESSTKNLNLLIDDLLQYSRVNNQQLTPQRTNIQYLLESILLDFRTAIDECKAEINIQFSECKLTENKNKLRQLFQNLIANSLKFRKENVSPIINISWKEYADYWHFSIEDNGIGIKDTFKEKIFHIFQRLNNMDQYEGSGIGLAICKKIVTQHHGDIWVDSKLGAGTTFHFTIEKHLEIQE